MNLNLKWLQPGESVDDFALCFGFDSSQALFTNPERGLDVDWLKAGDTVKCNHNVAILGVGPTRCTPDFTKWDKGDLVDGTARFVYPIINDPKMPFRAGLTLHATKGTWSSLPHEFEREEILLPRPMPFFEKFAYVTEEPGGWGIQTRIGHLFELGEDGKPEAYHDGTDHDWVNDTVTIRDREILSIPLGSHAVVSSPGNRLGYFWIYWSGGPMAQAVMGLREKFTKDKAL